LGHEASQSDVLGRALAAKCDNFRLDCLTAIEAVRLVRSRLSNRLGVSLCPCAGVPTSA
jgi:hypothetical protein